MITGAALDTAILGLPSRPRRDTYSRATLFIYGQDPLGKRRPIRAQRFNIAGGARVLYLGDDPITCVHEAQALGFPASAIAIVPVQFDLRSVVDLRDPTVQKILQTDSPEISFNFRSLPPSAGPAMTQVLGERVAASTRIDGLLYESPARPGYLALAIIEKALTALGSSLVVNDPNNKLSDRLP